MAPPIAEPDRAQDDSGLKFPAPAANLRFDRVAFENGIEGIKMVFDLYLVRKALGFLDEGPEGFPFASGEGDRAANVDKCAVLSSDCLPRGAVLCLAAKSGGCMGRHRGIAHS